MNPDTRVRRALEAAERDLAHVDDLGRRAALLKDLGEVIVDAPAVLERARRQFAIAAQAADKRTWSYDAIGKAIGVTKGRVGQILAATEDVDRED